MSDRVNLLPAAEAMLRKIVASNGGGVQKSLNQNSAVMKQIRKLEQLGLVQPRPGNAMFAIHTREGLEWVREADKNKVSLELTPAQLDEMEAWANSRTYGGVGIMDFEMFIALIKLGRKALGQEQGND